ncbi:MAG: elongation factor P [Chlorobi bacterium]|nr:elongation factor P [Chlorobiota bacterium]
MATTSDLRVGLIIRLNGELHEVLEYQHRTPGKGQASYQVLLRNLITGRQFENRFRSGEKIETVRVNRRQFQFLYKEDDSLVMMDQETFDQISISPDLFVSGVEFLKEGEVVDILFDGDVPFRAEMPITVVLNVAETEPGIRGDTATGGTKRAVLETGATVNVPLFIEIGDALKIDTRTGAYLERA